MSVEQYSVPLDIGYRGGMGMYHINLVSVSPHYCCQAFISWQL